MTDEELVAALRQIRELSREIAALGGEHLALRNRAVEMAASAETMLWSVAPDESEWLDDVYAVTRERRP